MQKSEFLKSRDIAELLYHDDDKCHKSERREEEEMLVFHLKHSPSPFPGGLGKLFSQGCENMPRLLLPILFIFLEDAIFFFCACLEKEKLGLFILYYGADDDDNGVSENTVSGLALTLRRGRRSFLVQSAAIAAVE